MRILYVVQRYGADIVGGSEAAARDFAEHLAAIGHTVEVVTSCARSYVDWANSYDPGSQVVNGVLVHRLPVDQPRRPSKFEPLHGWAVNGPRPMPLFEQQRWAKHMGPDIAGLPAWLHDNCTRFDVVIFMTYLYATTTRGLPAVAGRVPTILQPTAHDEAPIWVPLYDTLFRLPDAFLFFTEEERRFVERRFTLSPVGETIGIGIDMTVADDPASFRRRCGLGDDPYVIYVGRIDLTKGSLEAFDFFAEYKRRRDNRLKFVLAGEQIHELVEHPDVIHAGFLDEAAKRNAIAGAVAMVQPSRFESFSIVLCESWVQQRPAIVHADSAVLVGQARRSGGALPYRGFAEFEAGLDLMLEQPALADAMGASGRRYVEDNYDWPTILAGVERAVAAAIRHFGDRRTHLR